MADFNSTPRAVGPIINDENQVTSADNVIVHDNHLGGRFPSDSVEHVSDVIDIIKNDRPGTLTPNLLEMDSNLRNTIEQTGSVRRKQHWTRSVELTITNVANRTGTLAGDTTGLVYSDTTKNLTGWGSTWVNTHMGVRFSENLGGSRHSDGIIVLRRAQANSLFLFLFTGPDSKVRVKNVGSTGISNDNTQLLYVAQLDAEGVNDGHIIPQANDQLTVQARIVGGGDSIQFVGSYYRAATQRWYGWNPHNIASGRSEFSLNEIHIDGGGDIDRLKLAQSDTVIEHNTFFSSVGSDLNTPVAWGTRRPATTTTVQTYNGPFKYTGKVELGEDSTVLVNGTETKIEELSGTPSDDSIGTSQLKDGAVTTDKIADDAVTADKIADGVIPDSVDTPIEQVFSQDFNVASTSLFADTGADLLASGDQTDRFTFILTDTAGTQTNLGSITRAEYAAADNLTNTANDGANQARAFVSKTVGNQTWYLAHQNRNIVFGSSGSGTRTGTFHLTILEASAGAHIYTQFNPSEDFAFSGDNTHSGTETFSGTVNLTNATITGLEASDWTGRISAGQLPQTPPSGWGTGSGTGGGDPIQLHLGVTNIDGNENSSDSASGLVTGTRRYNTQQGNQAIRFSRTYTGVSIGTGITYDESNGNIVFPAGVWMICASMKLRNYTTQTSWQNTRLWAKLQIREGANDVRHAQETYSRWGYNHRTQAPSSSGLSDFYSPTCSVSGVVVSDGTTPVTIRCRWEAQATGGLELMTAHVHAFKA